MNETDSKNVATLFGAFIKEARQRKGITQTELARRVGVSQPYYNQIENGMRNVDLSLAMNICLILELDLNDFVGTYQNSFYAK